MDFGKAYHLMVQGKRVRAGRGCHIWYMDCGRLYTEDLDGPVYPDPEELLSDGWEVAFERYGFDVAIELARNGSKMRRDAWPTGCYLYTESDSDQWVMRKLIRYTKGFFCRPLDQLDDRFDDKPITSGDTLATDWGVVGQ